MAKGVLHEVGDHLAEPLLVLHEGQPEIAFAGFTETAAGADGHFRFFQLLNLKAQDVHFVLRRTLPVKDIVIIGVDDAPKAV